MSVLAAQDPIVTIIVLLFFGGVWVLSQVLTALSNKKKQDQQQPRPPRPPRGEPPGVPRPQREPRPPRPPRSVPPPRQSMPQSVSRRQQSQSGPPPLEQVTNLRAAVAPVYRAKESTETDGPTRRDRLKSILRPRNLRKEFILTEILQPPISVRPSADR